VIDIMAGRNPPQPVPRQVYEYFCARYFGYKPHETRNLPFHDIDILTTILGAVLKYEANQKKG
jgi:hypothetical protein